MFTPEQITTLSVEDGNEVAAAPPQDIVDQLEAEFQLPPLTQIGRASCRERV